MIRLGLKKYNTILRREVAKISASSSGKIHKFEFLAGEEILPSEVLKKR